MLYHLISLNPHKDITLHVSVNSPAMVCYCFFLQIVAANIFSTCSSYIINLDSKPNSLSQDSIHHTSIRSPVHLKMHLCFAFAINDPGSVFGKKIAGWITSKHPLPAFCSSCSSVEKCTEFLTYQDELFVFPVVHVIVILDFVYMLRNFVAVKTIYSCGFADA